MKTCISQHVEVTAKRGLQYCEHCSGLSEAPKRLESLFTNAHRWLTRSPSHVLSTQNNHHNHFRLCRKKPLSRNISTHGRRPCRLLGHLEFRTQGAAAKMKATVDPESNVHRFFIGSDEQGQHCISEPLNLVLA